jgi:hypothetical protein
VKPARTLIDRLLREATSIWPPRIQRADRSGRAMTAVCAHLPLLSCLVPERSPTLATGSTHTRCSTPKEIMKMPLDDLRRTEHCREGTQRRQALSQHARWSALQPLAATRTQPIVSARRCRRRCSVRSSRWSDGRRGIGRRASRFECCARRRRDLDTAGGDRECWQFRSLTKCGD